MFQPLNCSNSGSFLSINANVGFFLPQKINAKEKAKSNYNIWVYDHEESDNSSDQKEELSYTSQKPHAYSTNLSNPWQLVLLRLQDQSHISSILGDYFFNVQS